MAEGEACFSPTSKIAATNSRWSESGHVNLLDHRESPIPFFRDFVTGAVVVALLDLILDFDSSLSTKRFLDVDFCSTDGC